MNPFHEMRRWFIRATQWFVDAAMWCYTSTLPLDKLGDIFNNLSDWTSMVAGYLYDLTDWYEDILDTLQNTLSWSAIKGFIRGWLPYLEDTIDWWHSWTYYVGQKIDEWWSPVWSDIQGYIAIATQGFDDLRIAWDEFWNTTFPNLVSFEWLGIWWDRKVIEFQELIDSRFKDLEPFWAGWQDVRNNVIEFFNDPLEWLWLRFTDWFLGKEE